MEWAMLAPMDSLLNFCNKPLIMGYTLLIYCGVLEDEYLWGNTKPTSNLKKLD